MPQMKTDKTTWPTEQNADAASQPLLMTAGTAGMMR
jgi:uncharacterized protein (DUF2345 family)